MTTLHVEQNLCLKLLAVTIYVTGSGDPHELMNIPMHAMPYMNELTPSGLFQQKFLGATRRANKFKYAVSCMAVYVMREVGGIDWLSRTKVSLPCKLSAADIVPALAAC